MVVCKRTSCKWLYYPIILQGLVPRPSETLVEEGTMLELTTVEFVRIYIWVETKVS